MIISRSHVLVIVIGLGTIMPADALFVRRRQKQKQEQAQLQQQQQLCATKKGCKSDSSCPCYCSAIGHFRKKNSTDKPVFVVNDKNMYRGKPVQCYCKQWDLDEFPQGVRPEEEEQPTKGLRSKKD